jgi:FdhD protein
MNIEKQVSIIQYKNSEEKQITDTILSEYILSVFLEDQLMVKLICIPKDLKELITGYLYSEAVITSIRDIKTIDIDIENGIAKVELNIDKNSGKTFLTTDSGDFTEIPYQFVKVDEEKKLLNIEWKPETIIKNANLLLGKSELFKKTGNVHSVILCKDDKLLYFSEDIGRYNAFDKTLGKALKDNIDLSRTCIYTSGRIPSSIALKTIHAGIPMIVSRSAPTDTTIELAKKHNLTVVGFAKGDKMNLYVR